MRNYKDNNRQSAFTLLELMIVLAIAGVLAAVAFPSYTTMVKNNCLTTTTNTLVTHLQLARSESVKRRQDVILTAKSGDWSNGWTITDASSNTIKDMTPTSCATTTLTGSATSLTYVSTGFKKSTGSTTFSICDDRTGETGRRIDVNTVGRPNLDSKSWCS